MIRASRNLDRDYLKKVVSSPPLVNYGLRLLGLKGAPLILHEPIRIIFLEIVVIENIWGTHSNQIKLAFSSGTI